MSLEDRKGIEDTGYTSGDILASDSEGGVMGSLDAAAVKKEPSSSLGACQAIQKKGVTAFQ